MMRLARFTQGFSLNKNVAKHRGSGSSNGGAEQQGRGRSAAPAPDPGSQLDIYGDIGGGTKKHSLADTIDTSVTTPISLKTLINDVEEELDHQLSAADIAAASLASGLVARRAEPETLSDASVSPTAVVQQQQQQQQLQQPLLQTQPNFVPSSGNILSQVTLYSGSNPSTNPCQSAVQNQGQNSNTNQNPNQTPNSNPNQNQQRCSCQPQTSPLPHIKEEEESDQANFKHQSSLKDYQPLPPPITIASGYCGSCESVHHSSATSSSAGTVPTGGQQAQEYIAGTSSTPSPRIKLKFRKPHKSCWSRIVLAPIGSAGGSSSATTVIGSNSNETLASSSTTGGTATTTQNSSSVSVAAHHRLTSSSASALATSHPSNSQLLPTSKMQAEQGSIGDLQKYHSRYLKNRRHTLANVR
ncbi:uncharacterized protein Dere_GG18648 [Drosophila erecta]|uniref:Uncharacterized protein n=1 Tax=Drosophila erecta TaxID=7220 RepID=B3NU05_DROER|nr:uncharacterized protein Dere_GG18648 [Drosophila erecta]